MTETAMSSHKSKQFPMGLGSTKITCKEYSFEQLPSLEAAWLELFNDSSSASVFSTYDWTSIWWDSFRSQLPEGDGKITAVCAYKGALLIAIAIFSYPEKQGYGPKRLRPLGDIGPTEALTEETPLLLRRSYEKEAANAIERYLHDPGSSSRWDYAFLRIVDHSAPDKSQLTELKPNEQVFGVPMIAKLPNSWEEYYSGLSRSMKTNLSYYPRKLEKSGYQWRFRIASTPADIRAAIQDLVRLHRERVNSKRGIPHSSHIPGDHQADFLTSSMIAFAEKGQAWVGVIEINGEIVAAQAFLESNHTLTFYYSGYDTKYYDYSPLLILASEAIKQSFQRGITAINFLPDKPNKDGKFERPSEWKTRWGAEPTGAVFETVIYCSHRRASLIKGLRSTWYAVQNLLNNKQSLPAEPDID